MAKKRDEKQQAAEESRMAAEESPGEPAFVPEGPTTTNGVTAKDIDEVLQLLVSEIMPDPLNPNEQTPETFNTLTTTFMEDGYGRPIVVCPISPAERSSLHAADGVKYVIAKGEHRWRVARTLGRQTIPSVIREWDPLTRRTRLVRDNLLKGELNKKRFTELVHAMQAEHSLDAEIASSLFGFDSASEMFKHMEKDGGGRKALEDGASVDRAKNELKVLDDLSLVLNTIFTKYGHTLSYGFIAFMWGGQIHVMVEMDGELKAQMDELGKIAQARKVDINLILAAILRDGMAPFRTEAPVS